MQSNTKTNRHHYNDDLHRDMYINFWGTNKPTMIMEPSLTHLTGLRIHTKSINHYYKLLSNKSEMLNLFPLKQLHI